MKRSVILHPEASGFSLVEVLVALAILAGVMAAALSVYAGSLSGTHKLMGYERAVEVAEAQLAMVGADYPVTIDSQQGVTDDGVKWTVTMQPLAPQGTEASTAGVPRVLYEIRVAVTWVAQRHDYLLELHSLRLGATP